MQWLIEIIAEKVMLELDNLVSLNEIDPDESMFVHGVGGSWAGVTGSAARDAIGLGSADSAIFGELELTFGTGQAYKTVHRGPYDMGIQSQTSAQPFILELWTKDGDGTDDVQIWLWSKGLPGSYLPGEVALILNKAGIGLQIFTLGLGGGTTYPIDLFCGYLFGQLKLQPDGDVELGRGPLDFLFTMGDSTKNPATDPPDDWVEIKIGGTTRYIPAYAAS
jgi:hypothetical protein